MENIYYTRADDDSGSKTIIIVCVLAGLGGLIILLFLLRLFRIVFRLSEYRSSPLPPVQPLAHHREQQLAHFLNRDGTPSRPATWYDTYPPMFPPGAGNGSNISLLHRVSSGVTSTTVLSPDPSMGCSEHSDATDDGAALSESTHIELPPQPSFSARSEGSESPSLPATPLSHEPSPRLTTPPGPRSTPNTRRRPRPISMSSVASTSLSARNSRIIRGPPHGPHSNMQIVLPAPLGPSLYSQAANESPSSKRHTFFDGFTSERSSSRLSVVDQWAHMPIRSSSRERRSSSTYGHRPSASSISSSNASSSHHPRSTSEPPSAPYSYSPAPPVPPIPSIYSTYTPNIGPPPRAEPPIAGQVEMDVHPPRSPPASLPTASQVE